MCELVPPAVSGGYPSLGCVCPHQFRGRICSPTIICSYQICLIYHNLTSGRTLSFGRWGSCSTWLCDRHHYLCDLEEVSRSLPSAPGPHRSDSKPLVDLRSSQSVELTTWPAITQVPRALQRWTFLLLSTRQLAWNYHALRKSLVFFLTF